MCKRAYTIILSIAEFYNFIQWRKLRHSDTFSTYFITFTCTEWIPLFDITNSYDLVYDWFVTLQQQYHCDVIAYVIMPNHLHAILHFHQPGFNLNSIISNGKRFIAYDIAKRLELTGNSTMLEKLSQLLTEREKKKGQLHKVFKASFDAKAVITQAFLLQKINYIHNNPVSGKWMLGKGLYRL
jgi:putative transposase